MTNALFPANAAPIKLYGLALSGHTHRVRLMLSLLDLPYEKIVVDAANRAHKTPDYLAKHPFGQVPLLDDNGTVLWDSNAILIYLAGAYDAENIWLPKDPLAAAKVQQWLSVAAGPIFNGPCVARLVKLFNAPYDPDKAIESAHTTLAIMDDYLQDKAFLCAERPTLADIACYSYIAHAPEGGVDLSTYSSLKNWLAKIEALPRFIPMQSTKV
ncbi:glutathione S-transferase family protein [Terasakiella pusilla]|uniref:glutathione S-transferase family protein n=1 Tax=Terasakiella pusilla TaxID=64973 RepID=UPI003AA994B4